MAKHKEYLVEEAKQTTNELASYIFGFASSIILTLIAYFIAVNHVFTGYTLIVVLMELAIIQFTVQLFFLLHFGKGKDAVWRLLTLALMIFIVLIVVLGSIWIVSDLNYKMAPERIQEYMLEQSNKGF